MRLRIQSQGHEVELEIPTCSYLQRIRTLIVAMFRHAPRGWKNRWMGFTDGIRTRAPVLGGQFAVWGGLFAASDCTITHLRGKEDWKNSVLAGATTSGLLAIRGFIACLFPIRLMVSPHVSCHFARAQEASSRSCSTQ